MKTKIIKFPIVLAILVLLLTSCFASRETYSQRYDYYESGYYSSNNLGGISFNVFYNELRPHGRWINNRSYGNVWIPNVGRDFHPYATNGYWVMTDYGNTWVSNYSWGWAPFHYGRWYLDDYYGWAWVPGYEWAPAWVSWRSGSGYYGWAPMGPGINISININIPGNYWTFLPNRYMYHRNMNRYYNRYSPTIYNSTTIINNTYIYNDNRYYSGPTVREYEQTTGRTTTVRRLESTNNRSARSTSVNNNAVSVYRPESVSSNSTNRNANVNTTNRNATTVSPANRSSVTEGNNSTTVSPNRSSSNSNSTVSPTNRSTTNSNTTVNPTTRSTTVQPQSSSNSNSRSSSVRSSTSTSSSNSGSSSSTSRSSSSSSNINSDSGRTSSGSR